MSHDRRAFLTLSGSTLAAFFLSGKPEEFRAALAHGRDMASGGEPAWEFLSAEQAADVGAFAEQIFPGEPGSPGAKDLGVVYFIDKSLATWAVDQREPLTKGLDEFNEEVTRRWPGTTRFAALSAERQVELMKAREKTPFFQQLRAATLSGVFGNPEYGGNKDKAAWKLIGFEDRYAWQPPFGDYDAAASKGGARQ